MRRVTRIEAITKTKFKVYVDEQFAFVMYKGELLHYHIREWEEISEQIYQEIRKTVVLKRAKLRAIHLLEDMDRTEEQLRGKLRMSLYPPDIVEEAIDYVKSFGYVDDFGYARRFVENKKGSKSKREIQALLMSKGIEASVITTVLEECYDAEDGLSAIREFLRKRRFDIESASDKEKQKIYSALARKGFRYEDIRQIIHAHERNA